MRYLPGGAALAAVLCLFIALGFNPLARVVWIAAGAGVLWLVMPPHQYTWWAHVGLALFAALCAAAVLQNGEVLWIVLAQWAALVAWDLSGLVEGATQGDMPARGALLRARLGWLTVMLAVTLAAAALAARLSFTLTLPWALALGLALVLLLARVVRRALQTPG